MTSFLPWPRPPASARAGQVRPSVALAGRIGWAGSREKALWEPRLERLRAAAVAAELACLDSGAAGAVSLLATEASLPAILAQPPSSPLAALPLRAAYWDQQSPTSGDAALARRLLVCQILLTRRERLEEAVATIERGDAGETARLFGYPECCAARWAERLAAGAVDAAAALLAAEEAELDSAYPLLAALGCGPLRHLPCSLACEASRSAVEAFVAACEAEDAETGPWLREMAGWSVAWSAAAGIAEVKTPFFRYALPTDPALRHSVRTRAGAAGAAGVAAAGKRAAWNEAPVPEDAIAAAWSDRGFASPFALRSRYCSVVWEWTAALRGGTGEVLHLPCGDGLLLELIAEVNPRLTLHGIEADAALLDRARRRRAGTGSALWAADWARAGLPPGLALEGEQGRAVFVDPESLVPLPEGRRAELVNWLLAHFRLVVVYATDRALRRFGGLEALGEAAGLCLAPLRSQVTGRVVGLA